LVAQCGGLGLGGFHRGRQVRFWRESVLEGRPKVAHIEVEAGSCVEGLSFGLCHHCLLGLLLLPAIALCGLS
jgi:hypothetical protein